MSIYEMFGRLAESHARTEQKLAIAIGMLRDLAEKKIAVEDIVIDEKGIAKKREDDTT